MAFLLLVALGSGAWAVAACVPQRPIPFPRNAFIAMVTWPIATLLLQLTIDHGRGSTVTLIFVVALVAALPLGLAAWWTQRTGHLLEYRWRAPVALAVGLFVASVAVGSVTLAAGIVDEPSKPKTDDPAASTTTTVPSPTTSEPISSTTTSSTSTTTTTTTPPGPTSVAKVTTRRESATGPLIVAFEDFRTTKDSVSLAFGKGDGILIIFDGGDLGQLTNDYHLQVTEPSVDSAEVQIAMTQSQESDITVLADGETIATCHPAGTEPGTCDL